MTDDDLRDAFGDEITDALGIRSRLPADPPPVQHELQPVRSRRRRVTAAVVAFGLGAAAVIVVAMLTHDNGPARVNVATQPTSSTVPGGVAPLTSGIESWTWVSDEHGWALVRRPCGTTVCPELRETTDGGRTWTSLPTPDGTFSGVRFATPKIGWLFGPALFETRDGGDTWTRTPSDTVEDVEATGGAAMRLTTPDRDCGTGCPYFVDREGATPAGWTRLSVGPVDQSTQLLLQGPDTYAASFPNFAAASQAVLHISHDAGKTWTTVQDPCERGNRLYRTASASAAPGGVLVVLCLSVTPPAAAIRVSRDGGATFGPVRDLPKVPVAAQSPVAAGSASTVAVAYSDDHTYGVIVSNDGGNTWHTTLRPTAAPTRATSFAPSLGWQDAKTARVSFNTGDIWTTRDGGRSWTRDRAGP